MSADKPREWWKPLVDRFLAWPLPKSVCSDLCVTVHNYPYDRNGTSLLTAVESEQMIKHVLQFDVDTNSATGWMVKYIRQKEECDRLAAELDHYRLAAGAEAEECNRLRAELVEAAFKRTELENSLKNASLTETCLRRDLAACEKERDAALDRLPRAVAEKEAQLQVERERADKAEHNLNLRTKELDDVINNQDESRWAYWRKRAGDVMADWQDVKQERDQARAEVERLKGKLDELQKRD